ncbi:hypothetical protein DMN91_005275 [Ooceraea biroi]|uniref:Sodium channel protein Nach n=1 Tax=Ooceraea biroi TaxID=2015173 RepID=A0A3L8DRG1_OOCBI|nr:sodium channel protein Nach [Ooceraea biroi]RLU22997.1 hypothetical protein DMN91_005275 [Ooceraea biroi]
MITISQEKRHRVRRTMVNHVDIKFSEIENLMKARMKSFDRANFKSYSDQSTESTKELAYKFVQEYLQCSTIHGVKYLGKLRIKPSIVGRLFWALIMICSFLFLAWMLSRFWARYTANPTRTVIESFQTPIYMIPFPAITLCPLVAPLAKTRMKLLKRLRLPDNMDNDTANFLLRYGPSWANEHSPAGKDYVNNLEELLDINHMTFMDFLKFLRPCEDLFDSCSWNGETKNCSELFKVSYTFTGICCSFNYLLEDYIKTGRKKNDSDIVRTDLYGPKSGLRIVLHPDLLAHIDNTAIRFSTNSIGVVMFPHHPLEYVGTIAVRQILQAEQELWISVTPLVKSFKTIEHSHQDDAGDLVLHCADETFKLKYFPTYQYTNCFISCAIRAVVQLCGCVPYYYAPVADMYSLRICGWEDWQCLYTNADEIRIIQNVKTENFSCECINPCLNVFYDIQTLSSVLNGQQDFNVSPVYKNLSKSQAVLRVYLSSETFTVMHTIPLADRLYLLASVGGIFSLFVGCSFISSIEILYFIGLFLRSYSSSKKTK